jgi:hypothetical protein
LTGVAAERHAPERCSSSALRAADPFILLLIVVKLSAGYVQNVATKRYAKFIRHKGITNG